MDAFSTKYAEILADWRATAREDVSDDEWEATFDSMAAEVAHLRSSGQWRSGGRTLLRALGLQHREVVICRAVAWLLDPEGWHGLGDSVVKALLMLLDVDGDELGTVAVAVEESRGDTRADIVVRTSTSTVLIEAKFFADEQADQCDRLASLWSEESPTLVFLTRDGRQPRTAVTSAGMWRSLTWRDVAAIVRDASRGKPASGGGLDVIETLETYGG